MSPAGGGGQPPAAVERRRLRYNEVRDRFLAELPATAEEELQYYTRIGMYVFRRWQAIADDHAEGEEIDEVAHDARWDECTIRSFAKIRSDARDLIAKEVGRQRALAYIKEWGKSFEGLRKVSKGLGWFFMRAFESFVGAFGLLFFGLLFVWLAPNIAKEIRSAIDQVLPHDTRPDKPQDRGRPAAP